MQIVLAPCNGAPHNSKTFRFPASDTTMTYASSTTALLLAAGRGTRFDPNGLQNKLLAPLPDGTPVACAAARALFAILPHVTAVVRPGAEALAHACQLQQRRHGLRSNGSGSLDLDRRNNHDGSSERCWRVDHHGGRAIGRGRRSADHFTSADVTSLMSGPYPNQVVVGGNNLPSGMNLAAKPPVIAQQASQLDLNEN